MLELNQTKRGTVLAVKVSPNAQRDVVHGPHGGALKVGIGASPEKGKANRRLLRFLAVLLQVAPSQLEIVRGQTTRDKLVLVAGVTPQQVREALAEYLRD